MDGWKTTFLLVWYIFRFHVKFRGSICWGTDRDDFGKNDCKKARGSSKSQRPPSAVSMPVPEGGPVMFP